MFLWGRFLENTFVQKTKGSRLLAMMDKQVLKEALNLRYRINMKPHVKFDDRLGHLIKEAKYVGTYFCSYKNTHIGPIIMCVIEHKVPK